MEGGKMSEVHAVTIAEAVETMTDWLTCHYHQREANLARDPVAVYAQAQFGPDEIFCYQQLNDWVAENSEVAEVFPDYAAAYADLLTACKWALEYIGPHCTPYFQSNLDGLRGLKAAIAKAGGHEQEGE